MDSIEVINVATSRKSATPMGLSSGMIRSGTDPNVTVLFWAEAIGENVSVTRVSGNVTVLFLGRSHRKNQKS